MSGLFDTWKWFQGSKFGDGWKTPGWNVNAQPGTAGDLSGEAAMLPANMPMAKPKPPQNIMAPDAVKTGQGDVNQQNLDWLGRITGMSNEQMAAAKKRWENKGGFEGLMANPAFTLGLAMLQAGAEGKTLGAGAMDNVIKAAGISSNYKRLMEAKAGGVKEVTTGQMDKIKSVLETKGIDKPGWWRKWRSGNQSESYEQAVEDIAFKVQAKVDAMVKSAKASGKDIQVGNRLYKKVIDDMIASGEIQKKGGVKVGGYQVIDSTLESRSRGGPITKGKPYMVGEKGPEVVIPRESAKVLSNDDSRIFAMLLAANPQLQKVSKTRAEKILRNRFPEYFEV